MEQAVTPGQFVTLEEHLALLKQADASHDLALHNFQVANTYDFQLRELRRTVGNLAVQITAASLPILPIQAKAWAEQLAKLADPKTDK